MTARFRLLALAALVALASCAAAQAGDKPPRRAQKPDRNLACAAQGEGFVYSQESGSCIRVGGSVSAGFSAGTPAGR